MNEVKSLRQKINLRKEMNAHAKFRFAEMQKDFDIQEKLREEYEAETGESAIGYTDKAKSFYTPEFKLWVTNKGYKWKYE